MARIVVLGAGVMGSAFTTPLADNGHDVRLVGTHLDGDIIEQVHENHYHPKLRIHLAESVKPYMHLQLDEALEGADLIVLGVNSLGVDWAAAQLGPRLSEKVPVLMLTKGLAGDGKTLQILPQALRAGLPHDRSYLIGAIGGPSIAGELAARRPTGVLVTGPDPAALERFASMLRTPYYHVWTSTDLVGVEVCVALKNLYALAVGLAQGWLEKGEPAENNARMHNLAAAIFAQSMSEMSYMVEWMGGQQRSVYALPGAGDLYVTCQGGRNGRMGRLLGLGNRYAEAKAREMPDETIEGAELALAIGPTTEAMIRNNQLDGRALPLMRTMVDIICHDAPAVLPWDELFTARSRP
jgi:glycerol-3-phosphate dehydrogenase (NAD(P)+)